MLVNDKEYYNREEALSKLKTYSANLTRLVRTKKVKFVEINGERFYEKKSVDCVRVKTRNFTSTNEVKPCPICGKEKSITEFPRDWGAAPCKDCLSKSNRDKKREFKRKIVEYKGGKCVLCSESSLPVLEFHHIDPSKKEFSFGSKQPTVFAKVKEELDKCVLLCSNCHKKVHAGILSLSSIEDYQI